MQARCSIVTCEDVTSSFIEYDHGDRMIGFFDPAMNRSLFDYDHRGRQVSEQYPDGATLQAVYYPNGLIRSHTLARGQSINYAYDPAGLLTNITYGGEGGGVPQEFVYDYWRKWLLSWSNSWGMIRFYPDKLGRVTQEIEAAKGFTQGYGYSFDPLGQLSTQVWMIGSAPQTQRAFAHDALGRLTNLMTEAGSFSFSYMGASRLVSRVGFPNGERADSGYDGLSRLTGLVYRAASGQANSQWTYRYDNRDQIVQRIAPDGAAFTFGYDDEGRLTESYGIRSALVVTGYPIRYVYDRAGNRAYEHGGGRQCSMTYNGNNQLTQAGHTNGLSVFGYTDEPGSLTEARTDAMTNWLVLSHRYGNLTQEWFSGAGLLATGGITNAVRVRASDKSGNVATSAVFVIGAPTNRVMGYDADGNRTNEGSTAYGWDSENQLVLVRYADSSETRLRYDGARRLREVAEYDSGGLLTNTVRYVWDGWMLHAELDGNNQLVRTFVWGPDLSGSVGGVAGIGGLIAIRQNGTNYLVRTDGKGNVIELRLTNGSTVASYQYAPFGEVLAQSGSYTQPLGYQCKLRHEKSGIVYWGYRWYDPITGRWLSKDPIGISGGLNQYVFCANNPINFIDPLGLYGEDVHLSLTLRWAMQGGVPQNTAMSIARADQGFDAFGRTSPAVNPFPHFQGPSAREDLVDRLQRAALGHDEQRFGEYLHQLQDTFAHGDRFPIPGHMFARTDPDIYDPNSIRDQNMRALTQQMFNLWLRHNPVKDGCK